MSESTIYEALSHLVHRAHPSCGSSLRTHSFKLLNEDQDLLTEFNTPKHGRYSKVNLRLHYHLFKELEKLESGVRGAGKDFLSIRYDVA